MTGKMRLNLPARWTCGSPSRRRFDGSPVRPRRPQGTSELHIRRSIPGSATDHRGRRPSYNRSIWNLLTNAVKFTPAGGRVAARLGADGHARSGRGRLRARGSVRSSCRTCSSASRRPSAGPSGQFRGWGWAWPLLAISSSCTAGRSRRTAGGKAVGRDVHRRPAIDPQRGGRRGGVDVAGERAGVSRVRRSSGGHLFRLQQVLPALAAAGRSGHGPVSRVSGVSS